MWKMERVKGMIAGFGFLSLALLLKSASSEVNTVFIGVILVVIVVVAPIILSYIGRSHKQRLAKT